MTIVLFLFHLSKREWNLNPDGLISPFQFSAQCFSANTAAQAATSGNARKAFGKRRLVLKACQPAVAALAA
jgi:hypothetical protein